MPQGVLHVEASMQLATVRVRDDYSPQGFKIINESDLNEFHELWPDEANEPALKILTIGELVTVIGVIGRGVVTAEAGCVSIVPMQDASRPETIPADWTDLHWKKQVKLAKALGLDGDPSPEEARAHIAMAVEQRAGS